MRMTESCVGQARAIDHAKTGENKEGKKEKYCVKGTGKEIAARRA